MMNNDFGVTSEKSDLVLKPYLEVPPCEKNEKSYKIMPTPIRCVQKAKLVMVSQQNTV